MWNSSSIRNLNRVELSKPVSVLERSISLSGQSGKLLPAILIGWYYINSWKPPIVWIEEARWYLVLGLALFAFLVQKKPLQKGAVKIYAIIQGPAVLGAILSLVRATDFHNALYNVVAMEIAFITFLLMLAVTTTHVGRTVLLISHIALTIMWVIEIQRRLARLGFFVPSTFSGVDDNKNAVSLALVLGATAFLAFALFAKPRQKIDGISLKILRTAAAVGGLFTIYNLSLTYSRHSLLNAFVVFFVMVAFYAVQAKGVKVVLRALAAISLFGLAVYIALPHVVAHAPFLEIKLQPLLELSDPRSFENRRDLLRKGLLIVRDNPLIGIGAGNSKAVYQTPVASTRRGLIHNTYLTYWAEFGLLGLISMLAFISYYVNLIRKGFLSLSLVDQIWLLLFVPYFFGLGFKNSNILMMLAILAGIYDDWRRNQAEENLALYPCQKSI